MRSRRWGRRFPEQLHGLTNAVFLHVCGDWQTIDRLEHFLERGGIHQILFGKRFDGKALVKMFRQLLMNPLDLLRLLGTILGQGVLLRLKIQKEQKQFLNLQWQIQAAPRRTCSIQGGKDPLQIRAGGEDDGLSAAKDALNLLPFPSHLPQDGGFIVEREARRMEIAMPSA